MGVPVFNTIVRGELLNSRLEYIVVSYGVDILTDDFHFVTKHAFDRQTDERIDKKAIERVRSNGVRCALKSERIEPRDLLAFSLFNESTLHNFLPRCMECRRGLAILSVRPSVCLANAWIVTKRKKDLSRFLYHTI